MRYTFVKILFTHDKERKNERKILFFTKTNKTLLCKLFFVKNVSRFDKNFFPFSENG